MANSQLSSQLHAALNSHSWAAQFSSGFGAGSREAEWADWVCGLLNVETAHKYDPAIDIPQLS